MATRIPDKASETQVRAMAGEAIALPSLAIIVWSLYILKAFEKCQ